MIVEHQNGLPALAEVKRGGHPDWTRADDDDQMANGHACILVGVFLVRVKLEGEAIAGFHIHH